MFRGIFQNQTHFQRSMSSVRHSPKSANVVLLICCVILLCLTDRCVQFCGDTAFLYWKELLSYDHQIVHTGHVCMDCEVIKVLTFTRILK